MAGIPGVNTEYTAWANPSCVINTPAASYQTTLLPVLNNSYVWTVNIRIPPGHAGYTGIALIDSGAFVLPYANPGPAWFIGDDDNLTFPYQQTTGMTVSLAYYNTSTLYTHGWQVRIVYTPISVLTNDGSEEITIDPASWANAIEATTGGG